VSALFPELAGLDEDEQGHERPTGRTASTHARVGLHGHAKPAGDDEELDGVYAEANVRLARPGLAAGSEAIARFEQAFGLPGLIRSLKKTEGDEIELVIELPDGSLAAGSLVPPESRAWKRGKTFGLAYRGASLPTVLAKALLRFHARYDGVPFAKILAQIVPEAGDEHMLHNDYPESVLYAFAPSSGWRRFFEGTELYRGTCGTHTGKVAVIDHTDIECLFNSVPYDNRLPGFFTTPSVEVGAEGSTAPAEPTFRHLFTDIQDRDVIRGADKLLDQALENLADDPDKPDMVFIQSGCLPDVTGDDLDASAARTAGKLRLPVVVVGTQNDPISAALGKLMQGRSFARDRALERGAIALVGLPDFAGRRSLDALLERAGIPVLTSVLPNLDNHALDQLARVEALIVYPWDRHRETARRLCERLVPAQVVDANAPFGLEGTARWLRAIGDAIGRRDAVEVALTEELDRLGPRWRELTARARRYRVGFVVDQPNWRAALAPARSLGVPILAMLREMGFGVDVLVYTGAGAAPREPSTSPGVCVKTFRTCAELDAGLREAEAVLWYSELLYEQRLTRNGRNPFSLRQFRMGLSGAIESLAELVRLAELPFYRRYARYLGAAFPELSERPDQEERQ